MLVSALYAAAGAGALRLASPTFAQSAAGRIIVSGASGQLGGLVTEELLRLGVPAGRLILVSRTPDTLERYAALGAAARYGDFTEPESLPAAYAGGARMLLVSIGRSRLTRPEAHGNAIRAAVDAGVRQIAYTSWIGLSYDDAVNGPAPDHAATEQILRDSGAAWTMLRNSIYMNGVVADAAAMLAAGRVEVPENAGRITYITREDCAAIAAAVLATPGHDDKAYAVTGPEAAGPREIAAAASAVTGVAIDVVAAPAGPPPPFGSGASTVSADFETVVGRPPTSVRRLLEAHREELLAARG